MRMIFQYLMTSLSIPLLILISIDVLGDDHKTPITVVDFSGRAVTVSQPVKRIISLAPHITENVFSAGAGDLLFGVVEFSDYPETAKSIYHVGSSHSFSVEAVVNLNPDLIIVWSSGVSEKAAKKLVDLGFTVYMDEPRVLEDVAKSITDIGLLSGRVEQSQRAVKQFMENLAQLQTRYSAQAPVSMFYQVWNSPLMTINGTHIISDVIRLCGGHNIFSDAIAVVPKINVESVIEKNPSAIVASGMGETRPEWLVEWEQWPNIAAVKKQYLFFIHPDLLQRHTVRILQGAKKLCEQLEQVRSSHSSAN